MEDEIIEDPGCQINLDKGQGRIINAKWCDDIRAVCSLLVIEFSCTDKLYFSESGDTYLTYLNIDWIPTVNSEIPTSDGNWRYNCRCAPKSIYTYVHTPCLNTSLLANALGLQLLPSSEILDIKCPVINMRAGLLMQEFRRQSFNDAFLSQDFGNAYFIYINSQYLYSVTWKTLMNSEAFLLQSNELLVGQNTIKHVSDNIETEFKTAVNPQVWKQDDFLFKMFREKIDVIGPYPGAFTKMYSITFSDSSDLDMNEKFMCIHSSRDLKKPSGCVSTFARVFLSEKGNPVSTI